MLKSENYTLTAVHYVGTLLVIYGHSFGLLGENATSLWGMKIHGLGVCIMFTLSGFLSIGSYNRCKNWLAYYKKKFIRIWPSFVTSVILTAIVVFFFSEIPLWIYIQGAFVYIIGNALMSIQMGILDVFRDNPYPSVVNGALWTMPIQIFCFLLTPLWEKVKRIRLFQNSKYYILYIIVIAIEILGYYLADQNINFLNVHIPSFFKFGSFFFMGSLLAEMQESVFSSEVAFYILIVCACFHDNDISFLIIAFLPYLLVTFIKKVQIGKKQYICDYFIMYLCAFPIQQIIIYCLNVKMGLNSNPYLLFLSSVVLISAFAKFVGTLDIFSRRMVKKLWMRFSQSCN